MCALSKAQNDYPSINVQHKKGHVPVHKNPIIVVRFGKYLCVLVFWCVLAFLRTPPPANKKSAILWKVWKLYQQLQFHIAMHE